jgi:hypothetical protein
MVWKNRKMLDKNLVFSLRNKKNSFHGLNTFSITILRTKVKIDKIFHKFPWTIYIFDNNMLHIEWLKHASPDINQVDCVKTLSIFDKKINCFRLLFRFSSLSSHINSQICSKLETFLKESNCKLISNINFFNFIIPIIIRWFFNFISFNVSNEIAKTITLWKKKIENEINHCTVY